jgi:hypothetical protein
VPEPVQLSPRLTELFSKTKLVCFGRYALEVPQEAELSWGSVSFPSTIEVFSGDIDATKRRVEDEVAHLKREEKTAEFTYVGVGPIENSWQIRYYESIFAKTEGLHFITTFVQKEQLAFNLGASVEKGETEEAAASRDALRIKALRLRAAEEIPTSPGYCIEHGFIEGARYDDQEMVSIGIFLPSLPDISFSLSSNKDAYTDYSPADYKQMAKEELPLLARIQQAKDDQGIHYPKRTVLREGKRDVHHWHGEESLFRRGDGTHDFEWALVGTPGDVANPSEFGVRMYSKVEHDTVGAAKAASVSDSEAVALWDKLLAGLKFRVKVPGAPAGSYFYPKENQHVEAAK